MAAAIFGMLSRRRTHTWGLKNWINEGEEAAAMALGVESKMRMEDINRTEGNEAIEGDIVFQCFEGLLCECMFI